METVLGVGLTLCAFLIGGIPFGIVVSRLFGAVDPRAAGSGNIGFTNVLRVSGKKIGFITLLGDFGKGWLVSFLATQYWGPRGWALALSGSVVCGHVFSPFLRFQGGKGVATGLGSVLGLSPLIGSILIGAWMLTVALWKYSSGGALVAFSIFPLIVALVTEDRWFLLLSLVMSGVVLYRHKANVSRLLSGRENQIRLRSS